MCGTIEEVYEKAKQRVILVGKSGCGFATVDKDIVTAFVERFENI